ncbi:MAG: RsmE family RNA methyltransferase [Candidatus Cloacimonadota bacterium]|nr:RsmE family RNA methyltransferase [Candidatus Cloacimonadota bacterium]
MPCFYTPELTAQDKQHRFGGKEFHHLANVMRAQVGDKVILTNGQGILAEFIVKEKTTREVTGKIHKIWQKQPTKPKLATAFALLKKKNDFLIVEKLTELGVKDFFPFESERTIRKAGANTQKKFIKTAISAIKQCDNAFLPNIHKTNIFTSTIGKIEKTGYKPVVALEIGNHDLLENLIKKNPQAEFCLVFGPEGGFSEEEIDFIKERNLPVFTLGNHILRAETAAISAAAQALNFYLKKNPYYY